MRLGTRQRGVLEGLVNHDGWNAWIGRWVWDTPGNTARICEILCQKGLAVRVGTKKLNGYYAYKASSNGFKWIKENKA